MADNGTKNIHLRIPFATLLKIALFLLLVVVTMHIWRFIVVFVVAVLFAVVLAPGVEWMERRGLRRWMALAVIALVLFGILATFILVVIPAMASQIADLSRRLPAIRADLVHRFPIVLRIPKLPPMQDFFGTWLLHGLAAGVVVFEGTMSLVFVFVLALYLLAEGREMFEWLLAFVPERHRMKVRRTAEESRRVVLAYMRGQLITAFLCGTVALVTLVWLQVPAWAPLAVLAFLGDFIPIVGTLAAAIPAVLLAMTVSPISAVIVVAVYIAYHLVESYVIIPRVWGRQMRLSTLAVLLTIFVGITLLGPLGVLLLPFAAAYPIVERIWLRERLPEDTVDKHEGIEEGSG